MPRGLATLRPTKAAIIAFTPSLDVLRQMKLLRAVEGHLMNLKSDPDATIADAVAKLVRSKRVKVGDKLIIVTDILSNDRLVDSVQLRTVGG